MRKFIGRIFDCRESTSVEVINLIPSERAHPFGKVSNKEARTQALEDISKSEGVCYLHHENTIKQMLKL